MHRFFLPGNQATGDFICLSGSEAHHAVQVLRLKTGDKVAVLDGKGRTWLCEISECGRRSVILQINEKVPAPEPRFDLFLYQAVTKTKSMDFILQKGVEIGVRAITPVFAARTVVQLDRRDKLDKIAKWQAQAIEALKQCGLPWLPGINEPCSVAEGLDQLPGFDLSFVAAFDPKAKHPRDYINRHLDIHGHPPKRVSLWIGPEGDFTPEEIQVMYAKGVLPITLGASVLRSETAAIYGLSCLHYELSWLHQLMR